MAAAATSLPRVRFIIFHYESGLVLKIVFEKYLFGAPFSPFFFIFHIRALPTEEMKKEHALINSGGCAKLATCLLSSSFCLEMPFIIFSFFASAPAHYTCAFIPTCVKTWPAVPTPPKPCSRRAGTPCSSLLPLTHSILHLLFPLMYSVMATRLSLRPRNSVTPPP